MELLLHREGFLNPPAKSQNCPLFLLNSSTAMKFKESSMLTILCFAIVLLVLFSLLVLRANNNSKVMKSNFPLFQIAALNIWLKSSHFCPVCLDQKSVKT